MKYFGKCEYRKTVNLLAKRLYGCVSKSFQKIIANVDMCFHENPATQDMFIFYPICVTFFIAKLGSFYILR